MAKVLEQLAEMQDGALHIVNWSPGDVDKGDPCTQVHLIISQPETDTLSVVRMKTRVGIKWLIDALISHRDDVWPEGKQ